MRSRVWIVHIYCVPFLMYRPCISQWKWTVTNDRTSRTEVKYKAVRARICRHLVHCCLYTFKFINKLYIIRLHHSIRYTYEYILVVSLMLHIFEVHFNIISKLTKFEQQQEPDPIELYIVLCMLCLAITTLFNDSQVNNTEYYEWNAEIVIWLFHE